MHAVSGDELLTYRVHHPPPAALPSQLSAAAPANIQITRARLLRITLTFAGARAAGLQARPKTGAGEQAWDRG